MNEANNSELDCGCKAKIVLFRSFAYLVSKAVNKYLISNNSEGEKRGGKVEEYCVSQGGYENVCHARISYALN